MQQDDLAHLDLRHADNWLAFKAISDQFFRILSYSYEDYFGASYHQKRIERDRPLIFIYTVDNEIRGVSYVKHTGRRAALAVDHNYRNLGIARKLVAFSITVKKNQYSIIHSSNETMRRVLSLSGFREVQDKKTACRIASNESHLLSDFSVLEGRLHFSRVSETRNMKRNSLVMMAHGF